MDDITTFKVIVRNAEYVPENEGNYKDVNGDVNGDVSGDVSGGIKAKIAAANARRDSIIKLIKQNKNYSISKLAELLDVSPRTISRDIEKLKTEKRIQRVGDENTGYWELL